MCEIAQKLLDQKIKLLYKSQEQTFKFDDFYGSSHHFFKVAHFTVDELFRVVPRSPLVVFFGHASYLIPSSVIMKGYFRQSKPVTNILVYDSEN